MGRFGYIGGMWLFEVDYLNEEAKQFVTNYYSNIDSVDYIWEQDKGFAIIQKDGRGAHLVGSKITLIDGTDRWVYLNMNALDDSDDTQPPWKRFFYGYTSCANEPTATDLYASVVWLFTRKDVLTAIREECGFDSINEYKALEMFSYSLYETDKLYLRAVVKAMKAASRYPFNLKNETVWLN